MSLMDSLFSDERLFIKAYWGVLDGIDAPKNAKKKLLPYLEKAFFAGDSDNGLSHVKRELPEEILRWPEYDQQASNLEYGMHETMVNRIWRQAHGLSQYRRILQSRDSFPYLQLSVNSSNARPECVALDGKVLRWDDKHWNGRIPPCERLNCLCRAVQMSEGMIKRRGLTISGGE